MAKLEYIKCAICEGNKEETLMEVNNTHGSFLISNERFRLVKCKDCGLVYLNPRPIKEEINRYYNFNYYPPKDGFKRLIEKAFSDYCVSRKRNLIMQFRKSAKILDIGCGNGDFLFLFSLDSKWEAYGVEPNIAGYNLSKQKIKDRIFNKELLDCKFPDNYFDVVTMWHVFEHIYEPNDVLQEVKRILNRNRILIMGIPNINSLGFKIGQASSFHIDAPRHAYHYNRDTIKKILDKNKFDVLKIIHPVMEFPLDLYHSLINNLSANSFIRTILMLPILSGSLFLKPLLSMLRASETLIIVCKKRCSGKHG